MRSLMLAFVPIFARFSVGHLGGTMSKQAKVRRCASGDLGGGTPISICRRSAFENAHMQRALPDITIR